MINLPATLQEFVEGRIEPRDFHHRQHVQISYELLERHNFPEALHHLARGLRHLAVKGGKPDVYHETITTAFLALIAERRLCESYADWDDFAARNPDLFRKGALEGYYEPGALQSPLARLTFVLPRRLLVG